MMVGNWNTCNSYYDFCYLMVGFYPRLISIHLIMRVLIFPFTNIQKQFKAKVRCDGDFCKFMVIFVISYSLNFITWDCTLLPKFDILLELYGLCA